VEKLREILQMRGMELAGHAVSGNVKAMLVGPLSGREKVVGRCSTRWAMVMVGGTEIDTGSSDGSGSTIDIWTRSIQA